jgi:hypothetical protein
VRIRGLIVFGFFSMIGLGVWIFSGTPEVGSPRFEAHEYAEFRSRYETLRVQSVDKRVEHMRSLLETTEEAKLTRGMEAALVDFCQGIIDSKDESPAVQAEARLVVSALQARSGTRSPASVDSEKKRKKPLKLA